MVEALYGELDPAETAAFREHLASCAACRSAYGAMEQTLGVMNMRRRSEPDAGFWAGYWIRLRPRLTPAGHTARTPAFMPAWAYGIAAIALLAVGIYLGRTLFTNTIPQDTPGAVAVATEAPPDSAEEAALVYLGRTKNLLLDLVNLNEGHEAGINMERRQQLSRRLLEQSTVITAALTKPDQQLLRQLIFDLEIVLIQLANVEVKPGIPAVELVRKGVDQKSILLKINLEEMRAMARRKPPEESKSKL
jgi:hypothetical protein